MVAAIVFFWLLGRSRLGRSFDALRDDPQVTRAMGLNVTALNLGAFSIGAFMAGVAGGLYAHYMFYIESGNFHLLMSAMPILFVILGGMYTLWGPVLGAIIFTILPELLRFMEDWRLSLYGAVLVAMMILRPSGIVSRQMVRNIEKRIRRIFVKDTSLNA